jgi:hypothetical protein
MRRILVHSVLLGSILVAVASGTVLGHECFIASRSDTGDFAAGSHAKAWLTVATLEDVFVFIGDEGGAQLSDSQMTWAVNAAQEAGLPAQFTIFIGSHTISDGTPNADRNTANGNGLDHVTDWFPVLIGIYFEALAQ